MGRIAVLEELLKKENEVAAIAEKAIKNPDLLTELLDGLYSDTAKIRFASAKILRIISKKKPETLYPSMDFFVNLLDSENNILKWNAMDIIEARQNLKSDKQKEKERREKEERAEYESIINRLRNMNKKGGDKEK